MKYNNFTIQADNLNQGAFDVQVIESPMGVSNKEQTRLSQDHWDLFETLVDSTRRRKKTRKEMLDIGAALREILFVGDVLETLKMSRVAVGQQGEGLCVRLVLPDPTIAMLPWEYIHVPRTRQGTSSTDYLALDPLTPIVRFEPLQDVLGSLAVETGGRLKVLLALAEPHDAGALALYDELDAIKRTVEQADSRVEITIEKHLTFKKLKQYCSRKFDLFYFYGHGAYWPESMVAGGQLLDTGDVGDGTWAGYISLEAEPDGNGHVAEHWFAAEDLAAHLRDAGVRIALFCSCETARRDWKAVNRWTSLVSSLVAAGIPAVVAMQYKLSNQAGVEFATSFFESLMAGFPLEHAVTRGRIAIGSLQSELVAASQEESEVIAAGAGASASDPSGDGTDLGREGPDLGAGGGVKAQAGDILHYDRDWGLPALYMRARDGVIFPDLGTSTGDGGATRLQQEADQQIAAFAQDMEALLASQADLERKMEERKESRTSNVTTGGTHIQGGVTFNNQGTQIGDQFVGDKHVHGDQVTNVGSTTSTSTVVFESADKQQGFIQKLDELSGKLLELQMALMKTGDPALIAAGVEVAQQMVPVSEAKKAAEQIAVNAPAPAQQATIAKRLDQTKNALDKVSAIGESAAGLWETIKPFLGPAVSLLASARHLFGLP